MPEKNYSVGSITNCLSLPSPSECVEIPEGFTYETISKEEYDFVIKGIRHPVYAGSDVKKYRVRTSSPFVKNSSVEKSNLQI